MATRLVIYSIGAGFASYLRTVVFEPLEPIPDDSIVQVLTKGMM